MSGRYDRVVIGGETLGFARLIGDARGRLVRATVAALLRPLSHT